MEYKYICLNIIPLSPFATEPASDTLFGQICYTLSLMNKDIDIMLADYEKDPFLVVSDFFPMGYISAQQMPVKPSDEINISKLAERKKLKKKNKIKLDELIKNGSLNIEKNGLIKETVDLSESSENWCIMQYDRVRAHINRITGTTLDEEFAPFSNIEYSYNAKNVQFYFNLYLYVKEKYKSAVIEAIKKIGETGYGSKTSIGRGMFKVDEKDDITVNTENKNGMLFLSNTVISGMDKYVDKIYYSPVTRFGKHGALTNNGNPFKRPFVMASSGALACGNREKLKQECFQKQYIGKAVKGISYNSGTVAQGYGLYLPLNITAEK